MSEVQEKLARSLSAEYVELIPYLPYLLQDLWELGSSPQDIVDMIQKNIHITKAFKVLDLACGKGAVSIAIAKAFGCHVKGIDIINEFIEFANMKAEEFGVLNFCDFRQGDINHYTKSETDADIVIYGAAGDALGEPQERIVKLKKTLRAGGYIIIDDAYGAESSSITYPTRERWLEFFDNTAVELIDERFVDENQLKAMNEDQQEKITKRANELKIAHPEIAYLFDSYIKSQRAECDELENKIRGVTILLKT